jgi:Zn/Cd-binding protein ZinT
MFVGYYTNSKETDINFLETTLIGDVDMDDFFPDEKLDSTMVGKSQNQMSRITFDKSKEYANRKYNQYKDKIRTVNQGVTFLEISKEVRRKIQPIGK